MTEVDDNVAAAPDVSADIERTTAPTDTEFEKVDAADVVVPETDLTLSTPSVCI